MGNKKQITVNDIEIYNIKTNVESNGNLSPIQSIDDVLCKDGHNEKRFLLDSPQYGLFLPEMIWDEQTYKSPDSILLSICSTKYNRKDYIHNYEEFQSLAKDDIDDKVN